MWVLVLLAININNPQDVPGKVWIDFPTEDACKTAQKTVTFWLKFDSFKVISHCEKKK